MGVSELKGTTHFLRDFGEILHGISSHSSPVYRFSVINFPIFNEK